LVLLGVFDHGAVDDVGESSFQGSESFSFGVSYGESSFHVRFGVGVASDLGDGDAVDCCVGLAVASSVESEPLVVG
jgi:hypothetical protein